VLVLVAIFSVVYGFPQHMPRIFKYGNIKNHTLKSCTSWQYTGWPKNGTVFCTS